MPTIYAAMRDRLCIWTGSGDDWTESTRFEGHDVECVAVSPDEPDRVFVGTFEDGLHRSVDGGETFERVAGAEEGEDGDGEFGGAFVSDAVMSLAISPHDSDEVWAGTEPSRIYCSTDGGESWDHRDGLVDLSSAAEWYFPPRPDTHHVRWIEVDPFDPERCYVGIEAGAFVLSEDAGENWRERPEGSRFDNHTLAVHPDAEGRVYAAAGDGYAESRDGGETWTHPQEGLAHRYTWGLTVDPGDPDAVLVSSASGAGSAHSASRAEAYVYCRRDGADWVRLDDRGLPMGEGVVRSVLATGTEAGSVYALNNRGLYRSRDFGDEWESVGVPWSEAFEGRAPRGMVVIEE